MKLSVVRCVTVFACFTYYLLLSETASTEKVWTLQVQTAPSQSLLLYIKSALPAVLVPAAADGRVRTYRGTGVASLE